MSNLGLEGSAGDDIQIDNSSNVILDRMLASWAGEQQIPNSVTAADFHVTGGSSGVRIQRSIAVNTSGHGILVDGGSTGTVLSTDSVYSQLGNVGVAVDDAPQTTITSNSVQVTGVPAVAVDNGSTGAVIENNVLGDAQTGAASGLPVTNTMTLDASASPSAVADYNVISNSDGGFEYGWGGSDDATAAAFYGATGQGAHDIDNPSGDLNPATAIDSANSAAPGELSTDIYGQPRVDDPLVANTGTGPYGYYDRGAMEAQEPLLVRPGQSATLAPVGGSVTFTAVPTDSWASSYTYTFDFGDGTTATDTTGIEQHPYATTGTYQASVKVTSSSGGTKTVGMGIVIDTPAPLVAGFAWAFQNPTTMDIYSQGTTDSWSLTSERFDYGDCGPTSSLSLPSFQFNDIHTYAVPGIYTVTLTVKDAGGNTATVTKTVSTPGTPTFTGCGLKKILITPSTTGGAFPGTALSQRPAAPTVSGLGSVTSIPIGGVAEPVEPIGANYSFFGQLADVMRAFVDAF